jgi:selenocysteine lyase/cysteine desulfurase
MEIDVRRLRPAFLACSVHKWLYGPYGFSLVYVSPQYHADGQPLEHFERNREGADRPEWDETGVL